MITLGWVPIGGVILVACVVSDYAGPIMDAFERARQLWETRGGRLISSNRPIEMIAADVRRLRLVCALVPVGAASVLRHGIASDYDVVLVEAARSLGVEHVLSSLPFGPVRDMERTLLEDGLEAAGLQITR